MDGWISKAGPASSFLKLLSVLGDYGCEELCFSGKLGL